MEEREDGPPLDNSLPKLFGPLSVGEIIIRPSDLYIFIFVSVSVSGSTAVAVAVAVDVRVTPQQSPFYCFNEHTSAISASSWGQELWLGHY